MSKNISFIGRTPHTPMLQLNYLYWLVNLSSFGLVDPHTQGWRYGVAGDSGRYPNHLTVRGCKSRISPNSPLLLFMSGLATPKSLNPYPENFALLRPCPHPMEFYPSIGEPSPHCIIWQCSFSHKKYVFLLEICYSGACAGGGGPIFLQTLFWV